MKGGYVELAKGQIHYRTMGSGAPLILCHQAPMSSEEWTEIAPRLAGQFQVIAPDMIGHGNSYDPEVEPTLEDYAAATLDFMDALGIEKAMFAGNHSGGALATCMAVTYPERVSQVVVSCEMLLDLEKIEQFLETLRKTPLSRDMPLDAEGNFMQQAWVKYQALAPTASLQARLKPFLIAQNARLRPYDAHVPVLEWMAKEEWLQKIRCPTLVFGAENDLFFDADLLAAAETRYPQCSTKVLKDAGAFSTFEQPAAFADMLLSFFH